jgi:hypothetical protein
LRIYGDDDDDDDDDATSSEELTDLADMWSRPDRNDDQ